MFCSRTTALTMATMLAAGTITFGQAPTHSAMDPQNSPAAQQGQAGGRPAIPGAEGAQAANMEADMVINSQLLQFSADPAANHDKALVLKAACSNMEEIALSKAIQEKSTDASVKHVAEMMITEHQMAQDKLKPIADKLGVKLPTGLPAMVQAEKMTLQNASPEMADKAYLSMMKTGHLKTINVLADHQPMVKDADLKTWVDETLPKVREHASHVMAAAGKKGLPTDLKIAADKGM